MAKLLLRRSVSLPTGARTEGGSVFDYQAFKEQQYDLLADHVRRYVDMENVYQILRCHD